MSSDPNPGRWSQAKANRRQRQVEQYAKTGSMSGASGSWTILLPVTFFLVLAAILLILFWVV